MQPDVIASIITGAFAIISPIATFLITKAYEQRSLQKIGGRRKGVVGTWKGYILQTVNEIQMSIPITISFTAGRKVIQGEASYFLPSVSQSTKLKFTGGFLHERFIKFEYRNEDETVIQFGSTITDLSPDGRQMVGKYIGYGVRTGEIVYGDVFLERIS